MKTFDWKTAILDVLAIDEGANQALLKHIHPKVWRAELPEGSGKKTIASTFAHIHNVRLMWLKVTGKRTGLPVPLDRHRCTKRQAALALTRSAEAVSRHIRSALEASGRPHFRVPPERRRLPVLPRLPRRPSPRPDLFTLAPAPPSSPRGRRQRRLAVEQD